MARHLLQFSVLAQLKFAIQRVPNLLFGVCLGGLPSIGIPAMGMMFGIYVLTFVASVAEKGMKIKSTFFLATALALISYVAFVQILKLQFPVWPAFITG